MKEEAMRDRNQQDKIERDSKRSFVEPELNYYSLIVLSENS